MDQNQYPGWEGLTKELNEDGVRVMTYCNPLLAQVWHVGEYMSPLIRLTLCTFSLLGGAVPQTVLVLLTLFSGWRVYDEIESAKAECVTHDAHVAHH